MSKPTSHAATLEAVNRSLRRRYFAERLFQLMGILSVIIGVMAVVFLFHDIISKGIGGFRQTVIRLDISLDAETLGLEGALTAESLAAADYEAPVKAALRSLFPNVKSTGDKRKLYALVSDGAAYDLQKMLRDDSSLLGKSVTLWVLADDEVDLYFKDFRDNHPEASRLNEKQQAWIAELEQQQAIITRFNWTFFNAGDSREPELAGIRGAITGSLLTLLVTLALSFPIGVAAAIYLEEFSPRNRFTEFIEVNINNLAAVPSIIFGLLGLAIFLNVFGLPRSAPLVGGLVLSLMTLPTIIISSRAAIKAVPPSIREAALGMGASRNQMVLHFVLPLAMPGMLTGAIIGMARALGDTAPLLMIGMVAFIVDIPTSLTDPATVLPVQIFLWSDSPERAFVERTSATIMVLLGFLILMNATAVFLRKRLERRW